MHRCLAPCVELCEPEEYHDVLEQAVAFLTGRNQQLISALQRRMTAPPVLSDLRSAIRYREPLKSININFDTSAGAGANRKNEDYWAVHQVGHSGVFCVLPYRGGQLRKAITVAFSQAVEETLPERVSIPCSMLGMSMTFRIAYCCPQSPQARECLRSCSPSEQEEG